MTASTPPSGELTTPLPQPLSACPSGTVPGSDPATTLRGDVLSARSRMRVKYGLHDQVELLARDLTAHETVLMLALAKGAAADGRRQRGLLALTDQRLVFVPATVGAVPNQVGLDLLHALYWTPGTRRGALGVLITHGRTVSFSELANADGRDLVAAAVRARPAIRLTTTR